MKQCPTSEELAAFIDQTCDTKTAQAIEKHLQRCAVCQQRQFAANATVVSPPPPQIDQATRIIPSSVTKPVPGISGFPVTESVMGKPLDDLRDHYQILEELPRGGQAVVYKAVHKATKMKVALKVLLPSLLGSAKARHHFEREVELAASLEHPNIVTIRDSGISRGQYYFAMEYVRGQTLDDYAQSKRLDKRQRVSLFTKICDAMTSAHQKGVIHRDLKPSNILVDERGEPRIVDFGLAKSAGSANLTTDVNPMVSMTGEIKGTLSYMSPEQAEGRSDLVDVRSDIYSLGVILYLLLTGQFPYDVSGPQVKILDNIQHLEPTRPKTVTGRFDSELEAILLKCLAKNPRERYQSAAALQHDLDYWLQGLPIVAKSISSLYLLRKVILRHRYQSAIVLLLLVIVLSFGSMSYSQYKSVQQALQKSNNTIKALEEQVTINEALTRQNAFMSALRAIHFNRPPREIQLLFNSIQGESIEKQACLFLQNPKLPSDKMDILEKYPTPDWFIHLVIAEDHRQRQDWEQTAQAYQKSYDLLNKQQGPIFAEEYRWLDFIRVTLDDLQSQLTQKVPENQQP